MKPSDRLRKKTGELEATKDYKTSEYFAKLQEGKADEHRREQSRERAFQQFKAAILAQASPAVREEHLEVFEQATGTHGKLIIVVKTRANYEFISNNLKHLFRPAYEEHLAHLTQGIGFKVQKPKRPFLNRVESQRKLSRYLSKKEHKRQVNSGVSTTASELLGMMIYHYNKKGNSAKDVYMEIDGRKNLCFQFSTSYSGFAKARQPAVEDKRTIKEHIDRLIKIGVLLEKSDGQSRSRATSFWITFNPTIVATGSEKP